jgi:hypothetical protein
MYGIDAGMGGKMRSIAMMKANKKKKSKTSKIGDMLDKKEMEQAPRRPSVTKVKPASKMDKKMGKITTLEIKPGMRGTDPRLMKKKNK